MDKTDLRSLTLKELTAELEKMGEKQFRAKQIYGWLHQKQVTDFSEMTNLSKALREKLKEKYTIKNLKIVEKLISKEDNTIKYLFDIGDNVVIESVLMRYSYGNAVCISSQAGCRMGCTFCASTADGLERNLLAGEMAAQIYEIQKDIGERVSNVVIMGSGEPLDNYDNVMDFLEIIHSGEGNNLSHRHITLSTCGLVDKIYDLARENLQITLAISLHAPNNLIRQNTMPVARRYDFDSLIKAAKDYADSTKRRVTFEYALIKGVNDSEECARELASKLRGIMCHVNLIPVNDVKENNYIRSSEENIKHFAGILKSLGIETTIRRKLGSDINAACGQLRKSYKDKVEGVEGLNLTL
ncbi:MAG: 23S rRNA (adenine(2503)-C(2))-methyltransferase RlmN [Clostridia bacterium]|nr:23S rRNA (adenine(2503)-C(2))-methyltransferase RlmN [Clostridia bacterium]